MIIAKRTISTAYFLLALFALSITTSFVMLNESDNGGMFYAHAIVATFMLWVVFLLPFLRKGYKIEKPSSTIVLFNIYFLWAAFITAILPQPDVKTGTYVLNVVWVALPLLVTDVVYYFTLHRGKTKPFLIMGLVTTMVLLYTYYGYYDTDNILLNVHLGTSYYTLYMLPLMLCFPSRIVKIIFLVLISLAVFSSVKRGGVLALLAALLVFIVVQQMFIARNGRVIKIIFAIAVLAILAGLFLFLATLNENNIMERFESISEDGGSGRTLVWWETWRLIINQDSLGMLIGNGFDTVKINSRYALSAHNDYLEAWFDFGFIGALLYLIAVLSLFRTNILAIYHRHACAPAFSAMSTMVFILSLISHIGIYFWMNLVMMTNAFFIGWIDHDRKITIQTQ